jgi:hypothetical protein
MFVARSTDDGLTFGERKNSQRQLAAQCVPEDGGGVAIEGARVATAWAARTCVYSSSSW